MPRPIRTQTVIEGARIGSLNYAYISFVLSRRILDDLDRYVSVHAPLEPSRRRHDPDRGRRCLGARRGLLPKIVQSRLTEAAGSLFLPKKVTVNPSAPAN